jgi:hypothetical protein
MAWSNNLFYIAFLSQIFLMSFYLPNKILVRMKYVAATYPPETYPKLYPKPIDHYEMARIALRYVSYFILLLGLLILFAVIFWVDHSTFADDGFISEAWPAAYGIIQFLPLMAIELSGFSQLKQMRKANSASKRIADLRRRGLTDLVSPRLLGIALLLFATAIFVDLYVHDFTVAWGHDTMERALVLTLTNGLLAVFGAWILYGQKLNPHQSSEDRIQTISVSLNSLIYISMAMSVFFAMTAAGDRYNLDFLDAVIMSIYFQAIALLSLGYTLRSIKPDEIDFDVYKNDATAI